MTTCKCIERGSGHVKTYALVLATTAEAPVTTTSEATLHADLFGGAVFKPPETPALRLVKAST